MVICIAFGLSFIIRIRWDSFNCIDSFSSIKISDYCTFAAAIGN